MAKTFNPRRRNSGFLPGPKITIYSTILILLFVAAAVWRAQIAGLVWTALIPVENLRNAFGASDNSALRAELASTTARVADRDALYQENLELKARLGRDAGVRVMLAAVVMRPPGIPYDTLLVDAGTAEGVNDGDLVSAGGTALIGIVGQAYAHTSRVVLFSAPGETYDVLLRGSVPIEMQGQGGGSFVGQVPAGTAVAAGDALVFPGIAAGFAGTVSRVDANKAESFITLYARLPVDPLNLQYVEIRKK